MNLAQKILNSHLVQGEMQIGKPISIRIDQTITQDATGTMAYLQFEALDVKRVKTEISVSYVDHNTLQEDYKNADDHQFLASVAAKYGAVFSRPGNGICHQVHLERFGKPGKTLLGSDSHTPTSGGLGMIAIGAGGLDVALAMAGGAFRTKMPGIVKVFLSGKLQPWVAAKDIILEVLRRETVKGGVGFIYEYTGPGLKNLTVPERATITNMGAELGATTSLFPSDEMTLAFLKAQGREKDWVEMLPDKDATYDREIHIDLSQLEPMVACPHMPDLVRPVREIEGLKVDQVCIGSCTNSSYVDLAKTALILKGKTVHPGVTLGISPGSLQVLQMISDKGYLGYLVAAGARILEKACGPCIGQGFAPPSNGVSVRTFNRNFERRSGTDSAKVYLVSPEVAAIAAIEGKFVDPRKFGACPKVAFPKAFTVNDNMIVYPPADGSEVEVIRGPNIAPLPTRAGVSGSLDGEALISLGDNITTDHIMPAGKYLPLRSNVPEYAKHVLEGVDKTFSDRAKAKGGGFIIAGDNYGQGSSREHAALCPMYLGVKAVIAKSFARIHLANLINFGILPLTFKNPEDVKMISVGDKLQIILGDLSGEIKLENLTNMKNIPVTHTLADNDKEVIKDGGQLAHAKKLAARPTQAGGGNASKYLKLVPPVSGEKIAMLNGTLHVPDHPVIPFIEGDGVGPDIWKASVRVLDAAVQKAYIGKRKIEWFEIFAGEKANKVYGPNTWLPADTIDAMKEYLVAIKGPLTTPIGGGFRSLNVTLRQELDLYVCQRPVRYFKGVPSPVKRPELVDMVIFRENTEDIYSGIEWKAGTPEVKKLVKYLQNEMGVKNIRFPESSSIGIKPISIDGSKRLIRAALKYALEFGRKNLTIIHKGNIQKYTEGGFREWGYELVKEEFSKVAISWDDCKGNPPPGMLLVKDCICDAFLQQVLTRPADFDVIAATNLNGDYISDALAAQVGGIGIAPGGNINYINGAALFEATHGTAPKYTNQDKVNPGSLILSGVMMLDYMNWREASDLINKAIEKTIAAKTVTYDFARLMDGPKEVKCSQFADAIIANISGNHVAGALGAN